MQLLADMLMALGLIVFHSMVLICQFMTFSVAINSRRSSALIALLIASNFVEIKGVSTAEPACGLALECSVTCTCSAWTALPLMRDSFDPILCQGHHISPLLQSRASHDPRPSDWNFGGHSAGIKVLTACRENF